MKRIGIIVGIIFVISTLAYVLYKNNTFLNPEAGKVHVVASFYPYAFFAEQVGGDHISVYSVTPVGVEPHDFEPSPRDLQRIESAQLFIYNGAGFDAWAEKAITNGSKMNASEYVHLLSLADENEDIHEDDHDHEHSEYDPHFWLDTENAEKIVDQIQLQLSTLDPDNSQIYEQNAQKIKQQLENINEEYLGSMQYCKQNEIVVSHNAYSYLGKKYGFTIHSIAGLSTDNEASPQDLARLTQEVRSKNIKYILFETLVSPQVAQTLARETNTKTLVLNPIEGLTQDDIQKGNNYYTIMKENLSVLTTARECN